MTTLSPSELLVILAEPTRLRILNCLTAAPLFVSDLQVVLDLPQPTVSRHLTVLKKARVVRDTPIAQFVLYRLRHETGPLGRLVQAVIDSLAHDEAMRLERHRAQDRSRAHGRGRMPSASQRGGNPASAGEERS
jgi:ArsR family transcriptional regulator, arsenate/arsenite/antimonite-responsive transcriptional repressor